MKIGDLRAKIKPSEYQHIQMLTKNQLHHKYCHHMKLAEKAIERVVTPYHHSFLRRHLWFKQKWFSLIAGYYMHKYNVEIHKALICKKTELKSNDDLLWNSRLLFAQQIIPEPFANLETCWFTESFSRITKNHCAFSEAGTFEARSSYYRYSAFLLRRFIRLNPDLNHRLFIPSLRLTALMLSFAIWNEARLSYLDQFIRLDLSPLYCKKSVGINLIYKMQMAFMRGINFDIGYTDVNDSCLIAR